MNNEPYIEDCPVCDKHTLVYSFPGFPECSHCGWYPLGMPYDESDIEKGKKKYLPVIPPIPKLTSPADK